MTSDRFNNNNNSLSPASRNSVSLEEFDIRESFDALDNEKLGLLTMDQFYTLYLGLGYHPQQTIEEMKQRVIEVQQQQQQQQQQQDQDVNADEITVEVVLQVLSKFTRDRQSELFACFQLVDHDKKGYISAQDIERLSIIVGQPVSLQQAQILLEESIKQPGNNMMTTTTTTFGTNNNNNGNHNSKSNRMLRERDFERIFSPPPPPPPSS